MFNPDMWEAIQKASGTESRPVAIPVKYVKDGNDLTRIYRNSSKYSTILNIAILGYQADARIETMKYISEYIANLDTRDMQPEDARQVKKDLQKIAKDLTDQEIFNVYKFPIKIDEVTIPKITMEKHSLQFFDLVKDLVDFGYISQGNKISSVIVKPKRIEQTKEVKVEQFEAWM